VDSGRRGKGERGVYVGVDLTSFRKRISMPEI
jgi:hypothetical protein